MTPYVKRNHRRFDFLAAYLVSRLFEINPVYPGSDNKLPIVVKCRTGCLLFAFGSDMFPFDEEMVTRPCQ